MPTLARLFEGPHEVVAVVSQPDRRRGRGRKLSPSPVAALALERGVPLYRPDSANDPEFAAALAEHAIDTGVVVAFGQFLPKRIRELPREGYLINAHASLLPRYRGAAPIARAILAGETQTGISLMKIAREMDAGAVALVRELSIGADEDAAALTDRLSRLAAQTVADALDQIARGTIEWTEQDHALASEAPKLERADAQLDWSEASERIVCRVRAMAPKPGAVTSLDGEPLRILAAESLPAAFDPQPRVPGTVVRGDPSPIVHGDPLPVVRSDQLPGTAPQLPGTVVRGDPPLVRVATGDGWLVPLRVQRAGGKVLEIAAFLRGHELASGVRLGEDLPEAG